MFIFVDNIHFKKHSNFESLFHFLSQSKIPYKKNQENDNGLKIAFGNYEKKAELTAYKDFFKKLSESELYLFKEGTLSFWDCVEGELFQSLIEKEYWYNSEDIYDKALLFKKIYDEEREILISHYAVTKFWLEYWSNYIDSNNNSIFCVFSNVFIYTKVLSNLLNSMNIPLFVVEHFFTGNDFYFEKKYTHIPNNSQIAKRDFFNSIKVDDSISMVEETWNKFYTLNNKNVEQPFSEKKIFFKNNAKTVLLLTQVVNDFSIVSTQREYLSVLMYYKKVIDTILTKSTYNLIIKTHPYEKYKNNAREQITYNVLETYIYEKHFSELDTRLSLVENYNIDMLIDSVDLGIVFNSQSAFDILKYSKPVLTLGNAFYAGYGFTFDYDCIEDFNRDIVSKDYQFTEEMHNKFKLFLLRLFKHLINQKEVLKIENAFTGLELKLRSKISKRSNTGKTSIFNNIFKKIIYKKVKEFLKNRLREKEFLLIKRISMKIKLIDYFKK